MFVPVFELIKKNITSSTWKVQLAMFTALSAVFRRCVECGCAAIQNSTNIQTIGREGALEADAYSQSNVLYTRLVV